MRPVTIAWAVAALLAGSARPAAADIPAVPEDPEVRIGVPVDALAGGFLTDGPVLLLPRSGPAPEVVRQAIADLDPEWVLRLGGDQAISTATVLHAASGRNWGELAGPDRYAAAARISQRIVADDSPTRTVYLARADVFADAVVAGALPDGMLLLADSCGPLPAPTAERLASVDALNVVALGGATALCDQTLQAARADLPDIVLSGSDRDDDRQCTDGADAMSCSGQTLQGEILEAWVEDARATGGSLSFSVRLPSLFDVPDGAPPPEMNWFSYEDPDSQAAIRYQSEGFTFDVEVLRPGGSVDQDARSKYVSSACYLGGYGGSGTNAFSTLRSDVGEDPSCFEEVDFDTWELTVELTVHAGQEAAVDRLTLVP